MDPAVATTTAAMTMMDTTMMGTKGGRVATMTVAMKPATTVEKGRVRADLLKAGEVKAEWILARPGPGKESPRSSLAD